MDSETSDAMEASHMGFIYLQMRAERERAQENGKRAMMEFYVNTLTSDSDSDSESSTTSTSSSPDEDDLDHDGRSYQVTAPGEIVLATIEEDVEEDSGAESSGHWLFSADNTDTDSVIHVPAALDPRPPPCPAALDPRPPPCPATLDPRPPPCPAALDTRPPPCPATLEEGDSTGSDETLVVEEEDGWCSGVGRQQEAGVTVGNSDAGTTTTTTDHHYDSSASDEEDNSGGGRLRPATGGSCVRVSHRRRRRAGDVPVRSGPATQGRPAAAMLSHTHAARLFEKHIDDVFDFESLESCESVAGGSDAAFLAHDNNSLSGVDDSHIVFNTSATSHPFTDTSVSAGQEASPHKDEAVYSPEEVNHACPLTQQEPETWATLPHTSDPAAVINNTLSHSCDPSLVCSDDTRVMAATISGDSDQVADRDQPLTYTGPHSIDLFGLPVRWTPASDSDVNLHITDKLVVTPEGGEVPQVILEAQAGCTETHTSDVLSAALLRLAAASDIYEPDTLPAVGEGDTTTLTGGEARHRQPPTHNPVPGPARHHELSVTPHLQEHAGEAPALPGTGTQHDPADAMRVTRLTTVVHGNNNNNTLVINDASCGQYLVGQSVDGATTRYYGAALPHSDLPSGDSDTDTDNTDGDYDEEDHFAAELSLRISTVQDGDKTKVKSFRSSDILHLIGLEGGGAGRGEAGGDVSPLASHPGSSPEVPDSLRSSEGRSATRSVETLSEDSGLGDRDVRLTPSSPLPPISEAAPVSPPSDPVTARPRRQDVRQARISRALSCGDLRRYSDSDSEGEDMHGWPPRPQAQTVNNMHLIKAQQRPFKSTYANSIEEQYRPPPHPHSTHPLSASDGSDEEVRSRYMGYRGVPSKPRRHRSFHEAPYTYRQDLHGRRVSEVPQSGEESWGVPTAPQQGRRRPQPISVDMAEQFLSQEGLKSPNGKQTAENTFDINAGRVDKSWRAQQHPPGGAGTGGGARDLPPNQQPGSEVSPNGVRVGGVLPAPAGSQGEPRLPASALTPELTVRPAWPAARAPLPAPTPHQPLAPAPAHQYSSTPAQLPNECQPVHSGQRSSSPTHDPPGTTLTAGSDPHGHSPPEDTCSRESVTTADPEMADGPVRVRTKTYGTHGEVEVYLARADSGRLPLHPSPVLTPTGGADHRPGSRGVTFSPSVKEVNWRESYYEADPDGDGSDSDVKKVLVVTAQSPSPQRLGMTVQDPAVPPGNSPSVPGNSTAVPRTTTKPVNNTSVCPDKVNGRASDPPTGSSSSDVEQNGDKSPKVSTPIWQRFKLPKISSPKSPRPKLPPKPQSLSSRSSDTESSKPSSPALDSGSSTPSSPDSRPKKAPPSPRFFPWGSKREKKIPRPLVSPPPPPPAQVSPGQVGSVAGVKGEPDPSVSPTAPPREDSVVTSVPPEASVVRPEKVYSADSDVSVESGRSPSGDDSSDTAYLHSPRSGVSKPPLPPHLQRPTQQVFHKARLLSARRHYFSQERQVSAPERSSPPKDTTETQEAAPSPPTTTPAPPLLTTIKYNSVFDASRSLKERFERFSASARAERERLAKSTPDLSVIEASVRRPGPRIDSWRKREQQQQHPGSPASASDGDAAHPPNAHHGASNTHHKARAAVIHERYKSRAQRIHARSRTQSVGVLETDLDTGASREVLTLQETNLDDLYRDLQQLLDTLPAVGAGTPSADKARAKSLLDLEASGAAMETQLAAPARPPDTRAKSMEFLLDDGNKAAVQPPENELMKGSERQLSEAELRVRRSLQRLDVPEWMKNAQPQQQGFLLRRRDYGSSTTSGGGGGWSAYSSKTASMTSLGSSRAHTPNTPTKVVIPTRVTTRGMTGLGGVTSPASNCSISPSPSDRSGSLFQYPISRWSTSRLNSGTTTPTGSVTSTKSTATYTRQPYLGWRSQTSLASLAGSQSSLTNTGSYLTAADRLALGITAYSHRFVKSPVNAQDKENSSAEANVATPRPENEEQNDEGSTNGNIKLQVPTDVADVHSSIKEVTSAIVHYCNESTPSPRASPRGSPRPEGRAPSPRRLVWVESSFVGSRPITSPETPTSSSHAITPTSQLNGHDMPESGEATPRPPQPPGEYLLAW